MEFMNGMEQIPMSTMESIDGIEPVPTEKLAPGFKLWPGYHLKVSILVVMGQNYRIHVQGVFQSEAFLLELNTGLGPHALVQHRPYEIVGHIKNQGVESDRMSLATMAKVCNDLRERLNNIVSNSKQNCFTQLKLAIADIAFKYDRVYGHFPAKRETRRHPFLEQAPRLILVKLEDTTMRNKVGETSSASDSAKKRKQG